MPWIQMHTVSAEHAQAHFAELLDEAVHGEDVAIDVGENMVVRWVVEKGASGASPSGPWPFLNKYKGQVKLVEGWDDPIPEEFWDVLKP